MWKADFYFSLKNLLQTITSDCLETTINIYMQCSFVAWLSDEWIYVSD